MQVYSNSCTNCLHCTVAWLAKCNLVACDDERPLVRVLEYQFIYSCNHHAHGLSQSPQYLHGTY